MANNALKSQTLSWLLLQGDVFGAWSLRFKELEGVCEVIAGYTGGHVENPTYEQVCSGKTDTMKQCKLPMILNNPI